jgi:hypothetical protein
MLSSLERQPTPVTLASVLPTFPLASASLATLVPQEAPKEAKPEKKGDDPAIDDGSKAET